MKSDILICPVCGGPLANCATGRVCSNGHSFDLAKEGYLNLLLSHQRRSSHPGDDAAMIQARRRFFDSGVFAPLAERVLQLIAGMNPSAVLDCGCGEGHLLGRLSEAQSGAFFGVDISKEAVRCAAKRRKNATWIVANGLRRLPFADASLDVVLSLLAPRNPSEFARILKPGGRVLLGVPGPNHLIEIRSLLAGNAPDFEEKADEAAARCAPFFIETQRDSLCYQATLTSAQIADLIQMTPLFWCSSPEAKARIYQCDALPVTVSFMLLTVAPVNT